MASTYTLISSQVLASSASSVTFSSIPATYTDLVLRASAKISTTTSYFTSVTLNFNGDTASNYSDTYLWGYNTTVSSSSDNSDVKMYLGGIDNSTASVANVFGFTELYIPSYLASQNKPISNSNISEINSTVNWSNRTTAGLYRSTAAITSITLTPISDNFVTNSSFYLYGIKNS